MFLLIGGILVPLTTKAAPPQLQGVWFDLPNNTVVGPNDVVRITANVTDDRPLNGAYGFADLSIVGSNGSIGVIDYIYLSYNSTTGFMEGSFMVDPFWEQGVLYIQTVELYDADYEYKFYNNGTDFISPYLIVNGTNPDTMPPQILGFNATAPSGSVLGPGDQLFFSATALENGSGIAYAYVDIYYDNGNFTQWVSTFSLDNVSNVNGQYTLTSTFPFTVDTYTRQGLYFADFLTVSDNVFQQDTWRYGIDFNYSFFVNGTIQDFTPPAFTGVWFDQPSANNLGFVDVTTGVQENESGIQTVSVELYARNQNGDTIYAGNGYYYDPTGSFYSGNITVGAFIDVPSGYDTLYVNYLYIEDLAGNIWDGFNGTGFISPTIPIIRNPPPILYNITTDSSIHKAGEVARFYLDIGENASSALKDAIDVNATIVERRPDRTIVNNVHVFSSSGGIITIEYPIDFSAQNGTMIYIDAIEIWDSVNYVYLRNGIDFNSPIITVVNDEPPSGEHIEITVQPDYAEVEVGQPFMVKVDVSSFFSHDMPNVTLVVEAFLNGSLAYRYEGSFYLPGMTTVSQDINVTFTQEGTYFVVGTLYDDIGAPWSANATYVAKASNVTGPVGTTPTNSTQPTDNSTQPADNSTQPIDNSTTATNETQASPTLDISGIFGSPAPEWYAIFAMLTLIGIVRKKRITRKS